jgi:hypothetical protein
MVQHHRHPGRAHPSASPPFSLLRLSAGGRLLIAGVVAAAIWAAVAWAVP